MKYTTEKVLYFASLPQTLHVGHDEAARNTTLHRKVQELLKFKSITLHASDEDTGLFYTITPAGRVQLLTLQILWREQRGKEVSGHKQQLKELLEHNPMREP